MEFIYELILELVLECGIEASKSSKIPKYIRYPLIIIIVLFFLSVIALLLLLGIILFKENLYAGIFIIFIGIYMLVMSIIKFRKIYIVKKDKKYDKKII